MDVAAPQAIDQQQGRARRDLALAAIAMLEDVPRDRDVEPVAGPVEPRELDRTVQLARRLRRARRIAQERQGAHERGETGEGFHARLPLPPENPASVIVTATPPVGQQGR